MNLFFLLFISLLSVSAHAYLKVSVLDTKQTPVEVTLSDDDEKRMKADCVTIQHLTEDIDSTADAPAIPLQMTKRQLDLILRFLAFEKNESKLIHHAMQLPIETLEALLMNSDYLASISLQTIFEKALARKMAQPAELQKIIEDDVYLQKMHLPDHLKINLAQALIIEGWPEVHDLLSSLEVKNVIIGSSKNAISHLTETNQGLCSCSIDNEIKLWNINARKSLTLTSLQSDIVAMISKDSMLYFGDETGAISIWDLVKKRAIKQLKKHIWSITSLTLNDDGSLLFSASKDHSIYKWDGKTGTFISSVFEMPNETAWALAAHDTLLFIGQSNGIVSIIDLENNSLLDTLNGHSKRISQIVFDSSKKTLFSAADDAFIFAWDVETKKRIFKATGHEKGINCLAVSAHYLFSGGNDETIRLWDKKTGRLLFTIETEKSINSIIARDQHSIITGSTDGTIRLWDLSQVKKIITSISNNLTLEQALILVSHQPIDFKKQSFLLKPFKDLDQDVQYLLIESKKVVPPSVGWSAPVFTGYKFLKSLFGK
jgi:WD40 repeat protein